jgi:hypothetical protein
MSARCSLCWESFRLGDVYTTVWPKHALSEVNGTSDPSASRSTSSGRGSELALSSPKGQARRTSGEVELSLVVHPACFEQLGPGDVTRLFGALRERLRLPIAVLNGARVDLDAARDALERVG